jgi:hypothetical protein
MASSINTDGLDALYPVAGVDNDSQGFRDNFANIKTNLGYAKSEITDLQGGVARVDQENDFDGNTIEDATFSATTPKLNSGFANGVPTDSINPANTRADLSFGQGMVFRVEVDHDPTALRVTDFVNSRYCEVRLIITASAGGDKQVTIDAGNGTLKVNSSAANVPVGSNWTSAAGMLIANESYDLVVDVFSFDQGNTVYATFVGKYE